MIEKIDPQKTELARLVRRLIRVFKGDNDPEDLEDAVKAHKELQGFIEKGWQAQAALSQADLGELVFEAVMCTCATVIEVDEGGQRHPNCDMWDPKASEFVQVSPLS